DFLKQSADRDLMRRAYIEHFAQPARAGSKAQKGSASVFDEREVASGSQIAQTYVPHTGSNLRNNCRYDRAGRLTGAVAIERTRHHNRQVKGMVKAERNCI